jgi:hypothetical protein
MKSSKDICLQIKELEETRDEATRRAVTRVDGSSVWLFQLAHRSQGWIDALEWVLETRKIARLTVQLGLDQELIEQEVQRLEAEQVKP